MRLLHRTNTMTTTTIANTRPSTKPRLEVPIHPYGKNMIATALVDDAKYLNTDVDRNRQGGRRAVLVLGPRILSHLRMWPRGDQDRQESGWPAWIVKPRLKLVQSLGREPGQKRRLLLLQWTADLEEFAATVNDEWHYLSIVVEHIIRQRPRELIESTFTTTTSRSTRDGCRDCISRSEEEMAKDIQAYSTGYVSDA